jgi:hypothetical protein
MSQIIYKKKYLKYKKKYMNKKKSLKGGSYNIITQAVKKVESQEVQTVELQLPDGWVSNVDETSGKTYYIHAATNETTWEIPKVESQLPPGQSIESQLPPGWESHIDESSGKTYYYNTETNETSWDIPSISQEQTNTNVWEEHTHENSGKKYYYNKDTNETTWVKPY